jgi:hypothetical protein
MADARRAVIDYGEIIDKKKGSSWRFLDWIIPEPERRSVLEDTGNRHCASPETHIFGSILHLSFGFFNLDLRTH